VRALRQTANPDELVTLYVLVGLPGAGKTTWAWQRGIGHLAPGAGSRHAHAQVVSSDRLRELLLGDERDMSRNGLIFACFDAHVDYLLGEGRSVIADSTGFYAPGRSRLCEIARRHGAKTIAVVFNRQAALARNAERERPVPDAAMERMKGGTHSHPGPSAARGLRRGPRGEGHVMGVRVSEESMRVSRAQAELAVQVFKFAAENNLTDLELLHALSGMEQTTLKYAIRRERGIEE